MSALRLRRPDPEETVVLAAGLLALGYALAVLWYADQNSSLRADDLLWFSDARSQRFLSFIAVPVDVHAVPLHRTVTYLVTLFGRPDFRVLLLFLGAIHVSGLVLMYRALEAFAPNPANAVVTFWYATYVNLGVVFLWWSSALHRLPYVALSAGALYAYARFRREHSPAWALCTVLCLITALGFFEKGVIIPLTLGAIEAALFFDTDPRDKKKNWVVIAGLGAIAFGYFAAWRWAVGEQWSSLSLNPEHLFLYARASLRMLLSSSVGRVYEWLWPAGIFWAVLIGITTWRAPRNALLWAAGFVAVTASLLSTGVSLARWNVWGVALTYYSHRYYADVMALVVVFVALAWQRAFPSGAWVLRGKKSRWLSAGSSIMAMTALSVVSLISSFRLMGQLYGEMRLGKHYIDNVVTGMEALKRPHRQVSFVNGSVPKYLDPFGGEAGWHSTLLHGLGYEATFYEPRIAKRWKDVYRITEAGFIEPYARH